MSVDFPLTTWSLAKFMHTSFAQRAPQAGLEYGAPGPFEDMPVKERRALLLVALDLLTFYMPDRIVVDPSDQGGYQLEFQVREMADKARERKP